MPPRGRDFGNEIERMLTDRPTTSQNRDRDLDRVGTVASATATLDDLMAELHGGRSAVPSSSNAEKQRAYARPSMTDGGGQLEPLRASADSITMPPIQAKAPPSARPQMRASLSGAPPSGNLLGQLGTLGQMQSSVGGTLPSLAQAVTAPGSPGAAMRPASPMNSRRSVAGSVPALMPSASIPPERYAHMEARLDKMEQREQQLMQVIGQLQQQVATLARSQGAGGASTIDPAFQVAMDTQMHQVSVLVDELKSRLDVIEEVGPLVGRAPASITDATMAAAGKKGPSAQLAAQMGTPAEWEADLQQFRRELGSLAANLVTVKKSLDGYVDNASHAALKEEVGAQADGQLQLKQYLTQLAGDTVALQRGLQVVKQHMDKTALSLQQSIADLGMQMQTNAVTALAQPGANIPSSYGSQQAYSSAGASNAGGNGLEETIRNALSRPAMRELPTFEQVDPGMDNNAMAAAAAAFAGLGGRKSSQQQMQQQQQGGQGGLGAALALLNNYEDQVAAEQNEQRQAAVVAKQAMMLVDAKVKQVVQHVDRHMAFIQQDVDDRLRMFEQTIIKMAQQIDRINRSVREMEGAPQRLVITQGNASVMEQAQAPLEPEAPPLDPAAEGKAAKANWVKAVATATGRFVPSKEAPKKEKPSVGGYGTTYFKPPSGPGDMML